jgi:GcrA cell cycle regulator
MAIGSGSDTRRSARCPLPSPSSGKASRFPHLGQGRLIAVIQDSGGLWPMCTAYRRDWSTWRWQLCHSVALIAPHNLHPYISRGSSQLSAHDNLPRPLPWHRPYPYMSKKLNKPKTVANLELHDCRWPLGDPRQPDFRFCGARQAPGRPYCEVHWRMAIQPPRPRPGLAVSAPSLWSAA